MAPAFVMATSYDSWPSPIPSYFLLFSFWDKGQHVITKTQEAVDHLANILSGREEIFSQAQIEPPTSSLRCGYLFTLSNSLESPRTILLLPLLPHTRATPNIPAAPTEKSTNPTYSPGIQGYDFSRLELLVARQSMSSVSEHTNLIRNPLAIIYEPPDSSKQATKRASITVAGCFVG